MRPEPVRKYPWVRTASFSKASPLCPAMVRCFSPAPSREKAAGIRRLFACSEISAVARLQPLGAAFAVPVAARSAIPVITAIPVAATVAVVALKTAMVPASTAEPAFHMGQDRKASLLAFVEGLVERI